MAFLRKWANGNYPLAFWWQGKSHIKALGTDDEQSAKNINQEAEEQIARSYGNQRYRVLGRLTVPCSAGSTRKVAP